MISEIGQWLGNSLTPGIIGALGGSAITGIVALKLDSRQRIQEAAREQRVFQRDVIVEIQDKMWSVVTTASEIESDWESGRQFAQAQRESESRASMNAVKEGVDRLKTLLHRLEVLESRVNDDTFRVCVTELLRIGSDLAREAIDGSDRRFDELLEDFKARYGRFRELARETILDLVR